jgi:Sec-independent protein translocase protein TatA
MIGKIMELSFSEILVVCLIAFLVFGPEDFIRRSRQFGEWMGRIRSQAHNFRVMAEEELGKKSGLSQITDQVKSLKEDIPIHADTKSPTPPGASDV